MSMASTARAVELPFSRRAEPGGAECMMMLSKARIVLVLPVPGGPCKMYYDRYMIYITLFPAMMY